jgi:hypothetical protein
VVVDLYMRKVDVDEYCPWFDALDVVAGNLEARKLTKPRGELIFRQGR